MKKSKDEDTPYRKAEAPYMNKNKIAMDGSSTMEKLPIEAGDNRFKKYN